MSKQIISAGFYNMIVDGLQRQFISADNFEINAAVDIAQKILQVPLDENPDNHGQYSELLIEVGKACREADIMGDVSSTPIIENQLYNLIVDGVQGQFVDSTNDDLNAGIDVLQKVVGIMLDGDPNNKQQYLVLLVKIGKAVKEANLLD